MISSHNINSYIQKNIADGAKTPHSTSYPVLYKENGKYYLAVFTFFFSREDIEAGVVERPTMWAIADIETGEIIEERFSKDLDFSDASYDVKYSIRMDGPCDTSREYYDEAFALLDKCRECVLANEPCKRKYEYYLQMITANVPEDYRRFYYDLSSDDEL